MVRTRQISVPHWSRWKVCNCYICTERWWSCFGTKSTNRQIVSSRLFICQHEIQIITSVMETRISLMGLPLLNRLADWSLTLHHFLFPVSSMKKAFFNETATNSKLKFFTDQPSNYWILDTDYDSFAVVYSCVQIVPGFIFTSEHRFALQIFFSFFFFHNFNSFPFFFHLLTANVWVLTRERLPPQSILRTAYDVLDRNHVSLSFLLRQDQLNCDTDDWDVVFCDEFQKWKFTLWL